MLKIPGNTYAGQRWNEGEEAFKMEGCQNSNWSCLESNWSRKSQAGPAPAPSAKFTICQTKLQHGSVEQSANSSHSQCGNPGA